jgi:hypothetical protein
LFVGGIGLMLLLLIIQHITSADSNDNSVNSNSRRENK